jgi:hypothetical protein
MCSICWSHDTLEFDISSMEADDMGWNAQGSCCGFGSDGLKTLGYDCVLIPQPWGRVIRPTKIQGSYLDVVFFEKNQKFSKFYFFEIFRNFSKN